MNLTASLKRAPKWAWYASGGLALGVVGIEVWKRRATDTPTPDTTTNDATVAGTPTGSAAPSPVITPPVIVQPSDNSPDFSGLFGTLGDVVNNAVATIGTLATGDQGLAGTAIGTTGDIARDVIAQAGQAPAPVSQAPPIIVNVPAPTPAVHTPAPVIPRPAPCPSAFPHRSARGCYRCEKHGKQYTHIYQNGTRVGGNSQC